MTEWRDCPGFSAYQVSCDGQVRRMKGSKSKRYGFGTLRKPYQHPDLPKTLFTVYLDSDDGKRVNVGVNRLVLMAFVGPPPTPKHEAAHWDGKPANNRLDNLRWATRSENEIDKVRHGTSNRGERQHMARLKIEDIPKIRSMLADGIMQAVIAEQFGVARTTIMSLHTGRSWAWVP